MCPHTAVCVLILVVRTYTGDSGYVSSYSYYYTCDLILLCVLILLYMCVGHIQATPDICPHTTTHVFSYCYVCRQLRHTAICVSSYCYTCVLILLHVSSSYYMCVLILLYVSSYYHICVLILPYVCPHTIMYVSSYYYTSKASATTTYVSYGKDTSGTNRMCSLMFVCVCVCTNRKR